MSVATTGFAISYVANGGLQVFAFPYYVFNPADLVVTVTPAGGVAAQGNLNGAGPNDYTFAGVADGYGAYPQGGNVSVNNPAAGATVFIKRVTPRTQPISFVDNDPLAATVLEHGLDHLELQMQESTSFKGVTNGAPANPGVNDGDWYQQIPSALGGPFAWEWIAAAAVWAPVMGVSL